MADEEGTSAAVSAPEATPVADEVAVATATADEETEARNALEHNLKTKGKNSYYYAHANNLSHHNVGTHGGEPKLLAKAKEDPTRTPLKVRAVESYAWMDGKKRVKVLIDWEGADNIPDDDLTLTWATKSVRLDIKVGSRVTRFDCPKLSDEITGAKLIKKPTKFVISMKKADELTWLNLKEQ